MTETTTLSTSFQAAAPGQVPQNQPSDILLQLIVTLLAPTFLVASAGDIAIARMAALDTLNAYRARDGADLISAGQIIAFGLAALGSLGLSMTGDLSLQMTLRLRGNANACNRSAEQNRRALQQSSHRTETPVHIPSACDDACDVPEVIVRAPAVETRAAATVAKPHATQNIAEPAPITAPPSATAARERQRQAIWAGVMADVAAQITADLPNLPPLERKEMTIRATALNSCATDLLCGKAAPSLRPGDLAAMMRPNLI
jgi:hypothetical protein